MANNLQLRCNQINSIITLALPGISDLRAGRSDPGERNKPCNVCDFIKNFESPCNIKRYISNNLDYM